MHHRLKIIFIVLQHLLRRTPALNRFEDLSLSLSALYVYIGPHTCAYAILILSWLHALLLTKTIRKYVLLLIWSIITSTKISSKLHSLLPLTAQERIRSLSASCVYSGKLHIIWSSNISAHIHTTFSKI